MATSGGPARARAARTKDLSITGGTGVACVCMNNAEERIFKGYTTHEGVRREANTHMGEGNR